MAGIRWASVRTLLTCAVVALVAFGLVLRGRAWAWALLVIAVAIALREVRWLRRRPR